MTGIDALTAAELSQAAYTSLSDYQSGHGPTLPSGWVANTSTGFSGKSSDGTNQFIVFANSSTHQVVIAFKGSDNLSNFESDLSNDGATAYTSIQSAAATALTAIQTNYSGYTIMTDGHSLGGGMAATFAVENDLSGYGQNALPIAAGSISGDSSFNSQKTTWQSSSNTFSDTVVAGDPATTYYAAQIANSSGDLYVGSTTVLQNPNLNSEIDAFSKIGINLVEDVDAGYYALNAHSVATVVSLEQAGGTTYSGSGTGISSANEPALASYFENVALDAPLGSGNASSTTLTGGSSDPFTSAAINVLSPSQTQFTANLKTGTSESDLLTNNSDGSVTDVGNGYSGSNLTGTNIWQQNTTTSSAGAITSSVTGADNIIDLSNATITIANGASCTVSGTGDTIILGNNCTITVGGSSNTLDINGTNSTITDSATSDTINDGGSGNGLTVTGGNNTIAIEGGSENTNINGDGNAITVTSTATNDGVTVNGNNQNVTDNGGASVTINGTNDGAYMNSSGVNLSLEGTSDGASVTGSSMGIYITGNSDSAALMHAGEGSSVTGTGNFVYLDAGGLITSVGGTSNTASATSTSDTISSSVAGTTIDLSGSGGTFDTVNSFSDTLNLAIQVKLDLNGNSNNINGTYDLMDFNGNHNILGTSDSVIQDFNTVGDWLTGSYDLYDGTNYAFWNGPDPLALNLSGQAVQTVGITQSNTYYDIQNDGDRILTGWVTAGEGLLVYDPTNSNTATSDSNLVSGFSQLSALDSNKDGVLNAKDSGWSQLKVWIDATGEGNFTPDSLFTLDQVGITSINLNAKQVNQDSNGNTIANDSSFTMANGTTGDIAGINFLDAPDIGTSAGPTTKAGQLTTSAFNQLVSATAAFNPPASSGPILVANDNAMPPTQLAASH